MWRRVAAREYRGRLLDTLVAHKVQHFDCVSGHNFHNAPNYCYRQEFLKVTGHKIDDAATHRMCALDRVSDDSERAGARARVLLRVEFFPLDSEENL